MAGLSATPRRSTSHELLDTPDLVAADLPSNLADIRRLNRWFGGTRLTTSYVRHFAHRYGARSVLDVATGSADIPVALYRRLLRENIWLSIDAIDLFPAVVAEARKQVVGSPIRVSLADARAIPWPEHSVDVVTCCLALHHFDETDAVQVLAEMWRVARVGIVVTDLERSTLGYAGTWLATHTVARNRVTRNDGPLSVLRSYVASEALGLARSAGMHGATVRRHPFFRYALYARKEVR